MSIQGYLDQCHRMVAEGYFYDNSPRRCAPNPYKGRDCSTFVAFALIDSGYPGVNPCNNSFGFARECYNTVRSPWFIATFGPGVGTFITYQQARENVSWGLRGSNFGMSPDYTGDGHIETILGTGPASVGAHSHRTGIGYDANGINTHMLSYFAIPPMFIPEMMARSNNPTGGYEDMIIVINPTKPLWSDGSKPYAQFIPVGPYTAAGCVTLHNGASIDNDQPTKDKAVRIWTPAPPRGATWVSMAGRTNDRGIVLVASNGKTTSDSQGLWS